MYLFPIIFGITGFFKVPSEVGIPENLGRTHPIILSLVQSGLCKHVGAPGSLSRRGDSPLNISGHRVLCHSLGSRALGSCAAIPQGWPVALILQMAIAAGAGMFTYYLDDQLVVSVAMLSPAISKQIPET